MTVLSLFDGAGIGYASLIAAGHRKIKYIAAEIDEYARKVARDNIPGIISAGDVRNLLYIDDTLYSYDPLGSRMVKLHEGKIDLIIGGSPCQNLSSSGSRTGLHGNKSQLFFEYIRLLNLIKPSKGFLLENVVPSSPHDLSLMNAIIGVEAVEINSHLFGIQNRKRCYWTNIPIKPLPFFDEKRYDFSIWINPLANAVETHHPVHFTKNYDDRALYHRCAQRGRCKKGDDRNRQYIEVATDGRLNCLTTVDKDSMIYFNSNGQNFIYKLNVTDKEMAMGWPAGWISNSDIADTHKHAILGNGWHKPTITHIFSGIT
jgi:hypothetical protein